MGVDHARLSAAVPPPSELVGARPGPVKGLLPEAIERRAPVVDPPVATRIGEASACIGRGGDCGRAPKAAQLVVDGHREQRQHEGNRQDARPPPQRQPRHT